MLRRRRSERLRRPVGVGIIREEIESVEDVQFPGETTEKTQPPPTPATSAVGKNDDAVRL